MSAVPSWSILPPKCLRSKKAETASRITRPMTSPLRPKSMEAALVLFRAGSDTRDIAIALNCTEAAAANAIARARDAERGQ